MEIKIRCQYLSVLVLGEDGKFLRGKCNAGCKIVRTRRGSATPSADDRCPVWNPDIPKNRRFCFRSRTYPKAFFVASVDHSDQE